MNDQWQALVYILAPDGEAETPVHPLGATEDDVREHLRIFLDRDLPLQIRQEGQQGYTELANKAAVDHFLAELLIIQRAAQL